jgi:predicted lipoprotein with Yx(FWY)xxD motif
MNRYNRPSKTGVAVGPSLAAIVPATPAQRSGPLVRSGSRCWPASVASSPSVCVASASTPPRDRRAMRFKLARAVLIALVGAGAYLGVALLFTSPATAQSSSCAGPVTGAPTGPATVSAAWTSGYGRVLAVGSGPSAGCSLYLLTSDQLHALTGAPYACSDNPNVRGKPCDTVLWPALLTQGAPIAGPGVNPRLLGTVTRTDLGLPGVSSVEQVTYAGQPLYRFFRDETPGETEGANLNDPVTTPAGIWYLLNPRGAIPATGPAELELETAPLNGTGPQETVLAARMNNDFGQFPNASFPVYTLSRDRGHWWGDLGRYGRSRDGACQGSCAVFWPPVLTSGRPEAGPGVDQRALGVIVRPDGTQQVTYRGRPLYLFNQDAYIGGASPVGTQGIYGAGAVTPSGVFNTIPPLP